MTSSVIDLHGNYASEIPLPNRPWALQPWNVRSSHHIQLNVPTTAYRQAPSSVRPPPVQGGSRKGCTLEPGGGPAGNAIAATGRSYAGSTDHAGNSLRRCTYMYMAQEIVWHCCCCWTPRHADPYREMCGPFCRSWPGPARPVHGPVV